MMAKEKRKNNEAGKAAIGTLIIVFLSVLVFFIADMALSFRDIDSRREFRELQMNQFLISTILSSAMFILSIYLIYIYLKDYLELGSRFTLGILFAVISFMMFSIASNPILQHIFGIHGNPGIFMLIPPLFATISLAILAWISSR